MGVLARSVWLEREGEPICFMAGSTPPDWAAALITNPVAWAEEAGIPVEPVAGEPAGAEEPTGQDEPAAPAAVSIPPKAGPGSSASAWAAYALARGFGVEDDAKASEIREALEEAGIPVE